ncbi:MAG TPA: hypothetical protein VGA62_07335, partial [Acidimicrobiia bacterium]
MPATKTRRKRRAPSRSSTKRRPAAKRAPARRGAAGEPSAFARGRQAAGRQLSGHRADALAVTLFVVGAIFVLGLWTDLAGPVGSALADGTGAAFGRARVAVPVACFVFGVLLLWPRGSSQTGAAAAGDDDDGEYPTDDEPAELPT